MEGPVGDSFDPLATSELISSGYRRYLRSLLPVRNPGIANALDAEIANSPGVIRIAASFQRFGCGEEYPVLTVRGVLTIREGNLVITILRLAGATSIIAALRYHARRPSRPLRTIMKC
jgi:hypothetical protein